jgi:hypothetical protein
VTVVDPDTPLSDAVHVLATCVAVNTSWVEVLMLLMVALLVTEPAGPVVPWDMTLMEPALKMVAGPYLATVFVDLESETLPPVGGRTTAGLAAAAACADGTQPGGDGCAGGAGSEVHTTCPTPRVPTGPPKRLTIDW